MGVTFLAAIGVLAVASAQTRTIRVVAYNIQDDVDGFTTPLAGLITPFTGTQDSNGDDFTTNSTGSVTNGGVLEGIGEEVVGSDPAQPIDILALEETTSNTSTVQPIVDGLNTFYAVNHIAAGYAMSPYQATESDGDPTDGNGPNAMVYNTNTLQLIGSVPVDPSGGPSQLGAASGEYREVMRYEFAPAGVMPTTTNEFYVYVSHYKAGTSSTDAADRLGEAQIIRNDESTNLPANARVIYLGDYNPDNGSGEAGYQTILSNSAPDGVQQGQGVDPLNTSGATNIDWSDPTTDPSILFMLTEEDYNLQYRDDLQLMSSNVYYDDAGGLEYTPGTFHAFGNNATMPYGSSVVTPSNTALSGIPANALISPAQCYTNLTGASDHLPIVADYTIPVPASPQSVQTVFIILMSGENWASISGNAAAPYINNSLLPMASYAEQYYNPPGNHPDLPNYLWLEAGTNFGVAADEDPSLASQATTNHLVTLLTNAGISWTSYAEDITGGVCPLTATNQYVPEHNPMVYFDDVTNTNNTSAASCIANVRPFTGLAGDLQSNVVARYNFITPNLCDDMQGNAGCPAGSLITQGDTWLSNNIPVIMNSAAYSNNGAIFIAWDQGQGDDGPIGMIVISPLAKGGGYSNVIYYTHSSTLLTMQEIFNVGPLLGDAVNATDLSDLFIFGAQLTVSPSMGFAASGGVGGPFSPGSQVYTLSNTGGVAMAWSVTNTFNWLTISAGSGSLAAGGSTNIVVSINANANGLSGGSYSDSVVFATANGSGEATEPVSLTISNRPAQLSVSPSSGFASSGPPGGPFSPTNQIYTLSNPGGVSMNWTATNSTMWLTLSATSGTLAAGASTNITASINATASTLTDGSYSDTIGFTNTTNGAGNTTRSVSLTIGTFGFYDDFSTFNAGDLVGQQGWTQVGAVSNMPIRVSGGQVGFTGGLIGDGQTASKNFGTTSETMFYGLTLTLTNAPNSSSVPYFAALYSGTNTSGTANYRLAAESPDSARTNYVLGVRLNGAGGVASYTFGTTGLSYGVQYRVIVEATAGGTNATVYVNPTSGNLGAQTPYAKNIGLVLPSSVGSFVISQLGNGAAPGDGGFIGKVVIGDNFGTVYTDLLGAVTPVASFTANPTQGAAPLAVAFTDTSSNSPTSWAWTFGDGGTSTAQNPNYTYTAPGIYTVTLIASDAAGSSTNTEANYITALTAFQAWQGQYFGSTTNPLAAAGADPLGKGISNSNQFLMGLNPTNPASVFRIISVATTGNDVVVTWQTSGGDVSGLFGSGKTNVLEVTPGLSDGSYTDNFVSTGVTNVITTLGDVITNAVDAGGATNVPSRYYQIQFLLP